MSSPYDLLSPDDNEKLCKSKTSNKDWLHSLSDKWRG